MKNIHFPKQLTLLILVAFCFFVAPAQESFFNYNGDEAIINGEQILLWSDFNNDGLVDAVGTNGIRLGLFLNNGNNSFQPAIQIHRWLLNPIATSIDLDNDGFLDLIVSGNVNDDSNALLKIIIFRNTGEGRFDERNTNFEGLKYGNISSLDYNNDGKTDFLISGTNTSGETQTALYKNTGNFNFIQVPSMFKKNLISNAVADFNNDGFIDVLLAGNGPLDDNPSEIKAELYENSGKGTFIYRSDVLMDGFSRTGSIKWRDYDNDGDLDILISENTSSPIKVKIYSNDGNGKFTLDENADFPPLCFNIIEWEDFDNDGDTDLLYAGLLWNDELAAWEEQNFLYLKDNSYTMLPLNFPRIDYPTSNVADIDGDGDLDVFYYGYKNGYNMYFLENTSKGNTPPAIPANLVSKQVQDRIYLNWDQSTDSETNSGNISYELRIGSGQGKCDIYSPNSILTTGKRLMPTSGRIRKTAEGYTVKYLQPGTYYWSVQAVDGGYMASDFAPEGTFEVEYFDMSVDAPEKFKAKAISESSVELTWSYSGNDNVEFVIERSMADDNNFQIINKVGKSVLKVTDKNLFSNTSYFYRIKTVIDERESSYSDTVQIKTPPMPLLSKVFDNAIVQKRADRHSAAWGDFNNDGWIDLCVGNESGSTEIFVNKGNEEFDVILLGDKGRTYGVNWIDINNDGFLDLFLVKGASFENKIYLNNQDNSFSDYAGSAITEDFGESTAAAWADYDKDGLVDVLICNSSGKNLLFRNNGNMQFTLVDFESILGDSTKTVGCNWIDYDGDGNLDVFIANYSQANQLYRNLGDGTFEEIYDGQLVTDIEPTVSGSWCDIDNDGDLDLLTANNVNMDNSFYINQGNGEFFKLGSWPFANNHNVIGGGTMATWEDVDNDGDLDLFIAQPYGKNRLYIQDVDNNFDLLADEPVCNEVAYSIAAYWADYNNDGNLDLFMVNGGNYTNSLYRNNGLQPDNEFKSASDSNNRISIKLQGVQSNSYGIGAKVSMKSGNLTNSRYIACQSGTVSSVDNLIASFGVGKEISADISINWPSGIVQHVKSVEVNKLITIIEEETILNIDSKSVLKILQNPVHSFLRIELDSTNPKMKIIITDISGRVMNTIALDNNSNTVHSIDVSSLLPGIYLVSVIDGKNVSANRFSKL